jgi:hypothetical protein
MIRTLICVLLAATAAQGGITTAQVKVFISGDCSKLSDVYLVINGDDRPDFRVTLDPVEHERCVWSKNLGATISTTIATFSLRAGAARSGCQRADADAAATEPRANINFSDFQKGEFRNVTVKIVPSMPVSYVREVHLSNEGVNPTKCREFATLADGEGSISNAKFKGEDVWFDFGPLNLKHYPLGLNLNEIMVDDRPRVLIRDGVVYRLMVQRAKGTARSAPTFSSTAISLDIKKLGKFERAEFQVIK